MYLDQDVMPVSTHETCTRRNCNHGLLRGFLIVDDSEMIREMLATLLRMERIPFWTAATGAEGVDAYRQHSDEIALVMLDVRMPGMDGPQTYLELKKLNPSVACFFMSGDWTPYSTEALLAIGAIGLIPKPFALNTLVRLVNDFISKGR